MHGCYLVCSSPSPRYSVCAQTSRIKRDLLTVSDFQWLCFFVHLEVTSWAARVESQPLDCIKCVQQYNAGSEGCPTGSSGSISTSASQQTDEVPRNGCFYRQVCESATRHPVPGSEFPCYSKHSLTSSIGLRTISPLNIMTYSTLTCLQVPSTAG